jgi:hypothetical protein
VLHGSVPAELRSSSSLHGVRPEEVPLSEMVVVVIHRDALGFLNRREWRNPRSVEVLPGKPTTVTQSDGATFEFTGYVTVQVKYLKESECPS